jgi:hypothetical protein
MRDITLNPEQRLYVIATEGGMRPPGRPKGAYRSAEHEGLSAASASTTPATMPGRSRSASIVPT